MIENRESFYGGLARAAKKRELFSRASRIIWQCAETASVHLNEPRELNVIILV